MLDRIEGANHRPTTIRPARPPARTGADNGDLPTLDGAEVLAVLRRRKWLLLSSVLLLPLLTYLAITQLTPSYTATGMLLYDAAEYKLQELQSILRADPITDAVMASQAEVLRGMPVVGQVARQLNLLTNPEFNTSLRPPSLLQRTVHSLRRALFGPSPAPAIDPGPQLDPVRNDTLSAIQAALTVTPLKASHVLQVSFTAQDPVIAAAAVNNAMDVYVKSQLGTKYGAVMRAREWLEQRREVALHAIELLEEAHASVVGVALTQVAVNVHVRSGYADAEMYHSRYGGYVRE